MFGLEPQVLWLLGICLLAACAFEFVNGFHDTANAVATVIYTNALRPWVAVMWSAGWNFIGVFWGGIAVAMSIVYLLPIESLIDQNIYHGLALVGALIISAILWNVGTWYYGIPSSSSHALIGSILGVGLAFSLLPGGQGATVNWSKAGESGLSLLLSPLLGFTLTIGAMFLLKRFTKKKTLFKQPHKRKPPPLAIRLLLIMTCTLVSFFHGANDGQKGVGLIMLILISLAPGYFALDAHKHPQALAIPLHRMEYVLSRLQPADLSAQDRPVLAEVTTQTATLTHLLAGPVSPDTRAALRRAILLLTTRSTQLLKSEQLRLSPADRATYQTTLTELRTFTDYAPWQVLLLVSVSLALGTTIGWQRIVKTIGERIGKEHLTYAQGASSELIAAAMIGVNTQFGLPVSTTHVLTSSIAGSMVASRGVKNVNPQMVRSIALAWVLTVPVTVLLAGGLFLLFRTLLG